MYTNYFTYSKIDYNIRNNKEDFLSIINYDSNYPDEYI
jgi:hypothetical protein